MGKQLSLCSFSDSVATCDWTVALTLNPEVKHSAFIMSTDRKIRCN